MFVRTKYFTKIVLINICLAILFGFTAKVVAGDGTLITDFAIAPAGDVVAFDFQTDTAQSQGRGIGLLNLRTGKLSRIRSLMSEEFSQPSFSPDGQRLAVVATTKISLLESEFTIGIIDLRTAKFTRLNDVGGGKTKKSFPVFGNREIIYVCSNGVSQFLESYDFQTGAARALIPRDLGSFYRIDKPIFYGVSEIIFSGTNPTNSTLSSEIKGLNFANFPTIGYRFDRNKGTINLGFPIIERAFDEPYLHYAMRFMASRPTNGEIYFIGRTNPFSRGIQAYDVFALAPDGSLNRLTSLDSRLAYLSVSDNGNLIAFGMDKSRNNEFDLYLYDRAHGTVTGTDLRQKVANDDDFDSVP